MLTVVSWLWEPYPGYRKTFTAHDVNVLRAMVRRHLSVEHEFVCVTDIQEGIDPDIRIVPLWPQIAEQARKGRPNCYRRLKAFSADAGQWLGERILSIDLDCVIVKDITPLATRSEEFVIFGDTAVNTPYNGSLWLLKAGSRTAVWEKFTPEAPHITEAKGIIGSDQAWIAHVLGNGEAKFTKKEGVYIFQRDVMKPLGGSLPKEARIVFFLGHDHPAKERKMGRCPWVDEAWR